MYRVLVKTKDGWEEMGVSPSFSDAWNYARTLCGEVKIVGPEGEWRVK